MKRIMALIVVALLLLSSVACGGQGNSKPSTTESTAEPAPVVKDTIIFGYATEPSNLSTTENNEIASYYPTALIHAGLFRYTADGIKNDLCTEYHTEKDADGVENIWVLKIREGVKFTDGTDLTAQDVVDTLNFVHERPTVAGLTSFYTNAEFVDDTTVKLHTNGVYATVPAALAQKACYILPSEKIAADWDFSNDPVGCGPYKLVKWNKGDRMEFVANEDYYGTKPAIKNVIWRIIGEATSRTLSLENGEVDFVIAYDSLALDRLKANDKIIVSNTPGSSFVYLCLNALKEPFNDVNFRKFLACAISREDCVTVGYNNLATPLTGCININIDGTTDENAEKYNPDKAQEYLKAWGGDPSKVTFDIAVASSETARKKVAELIQNTMSEYGITCTVTQTESANCSVIAKSGEYDTIVFAYNTNDFAAYCKNLYYVSDEAHVGNKFRMSGDDSLNALIDEINSTTDAAKRKEMITEFVKQLNEKQPVIPIACVSTMIAYSSDIQGVTVDNQGYIRVEEMSWK